MVLLRLMTNPAVTGRDALSRRAAWDAVGQLMTDSRVRFLSEPETLLPLWKAFSKKHDRNHLLWTVPLLFCRNSRQHHVLGRAVYARSLLQARSVFSGTLEE